MKTEYDFYCDLYHRQEPITCYRLLLVIKRKIWNSFFKILDKNEIEKLLYNFYVVKLNSVVTITITNR